MGWKPCAHCRLAVGIWNFSGQGLHQLPLSVGDLVCVQEECEGWYRGYLYLFPSKKGIFPASHVQPKEFVPSSDGSYALPKEDPVALEAKEHLHEWKKSLFKHFVDGSRQEFFQLLNYMDGVITTRWNLVQGKMTVEAVQQTRVRLTAKIDRINAMCDLPLNVRDGTGMLVNPHKMSTQQLYKTHQQREDDIQKRVPHTGWEQQNTKGPVSLQVHHLYVTIRSIKQFCPEECEVFFFLYDNERKKQISERFLMPVMRSADTVRYHSHQPRSQQCDALFTDLGAQEIQSPSLYLVCQITRKGKMLLDDKKNTSQYPFRRPYAVGVLDLHQSLREVSPERRMSDEEDDYQTIYEMSLHICTTHESDFATYHSTLIKKGALKQAQKGTSVSLSVRPLQGDLEQLRKDFALLINKNTVIVNKLGFPDVILPGDHRDDIYITLEQGQFERGSKRAERNVEVAMSVCDDRGKALPGCILPAAGGQALSEYESFIFYHNNTPRWTETFKLSIPFGKIKDCHLRVSFRHVAKNENKDKMDKTFAFTHLKLIKEDGSIIPDGAHELYLFKTEGNKRWYDPTLSHYLAWNSIKEEVAMIRTRGKTMSTSVDMGAQLGPSTLSRSTRETVFITTLNCSTKLTQNVNMLSLLKWRTMPSITLPLTLGKVLSIDGEEIVKFLQNILDCLFDILNEDPEKYGRAVFDALVYIFDRLTNKRYENFMSVLDIYLNKHFSAALAFKVLLRWFSELVMLCDDIIQHQMDLCTMLNSMKPLFQFAVQSHSLYIKNTRKADPSFTALVDRAIQAMCGVLGKSEDKYHGVHVVQAAILRNLPSILPFLTEAFSKRQIAAHVAMVLDSIRNIHPSLPAEKTTFTLAVIDSPMHLLDTQDAREVLIPTIIGHMISHLEHMMPLNGYKCDDIGNKGCMACIGRVLEILADESLHISFTDIEIITHLLIPLLRTTTFLQKAKNSLQSEAQVNLIGLFRVMTDQHYAIFTDSLKSERSSDQLREFLSDLQECFRALISHPPHPCSWVILYLTQNSVILRVLKNMSKAMLDNFFDDRNFSPQIWDVFFELCTVFAAQECLQLEKHSDLRRKKLFREFGDMRLMLGKHVRVMWTRLGDKRGNFIPHLIGPFLEITLLNRRELRKLAIPLIFDMMECEQGASGNIKRVETEVFDKVDDLVSKGYGDEEYRDMIYDMLVPLCQEKEALAQSGPAFLELVRNLIGLLLDYRSVRNDETNRGKRMGCMLNLMNFYKGIEKEELYIRYIYRLAELHEREENYTEAGLTLLLHAESLEWTSGLIQSEEGTFTQQTALERKEALYKEAIRLFDQGKTWECGIRLCKELAHLYESQLFDYEKLSWILRTEAEFFHKIITELRVEHEYFLVVYCGKGFPLFLRNKTFIHRGQPYEKLSAFVKRLTDEFPAAETLKKLVIDPELQNSNGMYLQVRKVQPIPEEKEGFAGKKIPDKIAFYYKTNEVMNFTYDRPFHKGKKDPECEFATLWIERTTFTSSSSFPGVIGWFEVVDTETLEMNPLDIATETVASKTREIAHVTNEYSTKLSSNINPLSMLLKGVIDAAVMGGISNYEKIFFVPKYVQDHPEHEQGVKQLKTLIEEQVEVLRKALQLHSERVPQQLLAFHQDLEQRFEEFQEVVNPELREAKRRAMFAQSSSASVRRSATLSRPLPPTPPVEIEPSMANLKRPHRRGTGPPSKIVNSPMKSRTSTVGATDRLSIISEGSQSVTGNTPTHSASSLSRSDSPVDIDDEGDNYEIVDLHSSRRLTPSSSSSSVTSSTTPSSFPAPHYPAPLPPPRYDGGSEDDLDDLHDYEKVTLGGYVPHRQPPDHAKEFATLPLKKHRPRSPSPSAPSQAIPMNRETSIPHQFGYPVQPSSPPPSPPKDDDNFGVLSFPIKPKSRSASPPPVDGGDPIFETIGMIQRKVFMGEVSAPEAPPINTIPTIAAGSAPGGRPLSQPYFDHLFPAQPPLNRPLPPDPPVDDDVYWDHLVSKPSEPDSGIESEYSLVQNWTSQDSEVTGNSSSSGVPNNGVTTNSMYDMVRQSPGTKKESSPPAKPAPFKRSPAHSPVPSHESHSVPAGSAAAPPPIPLKKRASMINHNRVVNTGAQSTTPLVGTYADPSSLSATPGKLPPPPTDDKNWLGFHSYVEIDLPERDPAVRPRPQPTPRARSHTIAGRKIQNSSPVALPRKQLQSLSGPQHEAGNDPDGPLSSSLSNPVYSSPFSAVSVPSRPPPPAKATPQVTSPPPSIPPKLPADRPVLPPRTADAPSLPPKPQKPPLPPREPSSGPSIPPRSAKPAPPLPAKR